MKYSQIIQHELWKKTIGSYPALFVTIDYASRRIHLDKDTYTFSQNLFRFVDKNGVEYTIPFAYLATITNGEVDPGRVRMIEVRPGTIAIYSINNTVHYKQVDEVKPVAEIKKAPLTTEEILDPKSQYYLIV